MNRTDYNAFRAYVNTTITQHPNKEKFCFKEGETYGGVKLTREIVDACAKKYLNKGFDVEISETCTDDYLSSIGVKKGNTFTFTSGIDYSRLRENRKATFSIRRPTKTESQPSSSKKKSTQKPVSSSLVEPKISLAASPQFDPQQARIMIIRDHLLEYMQQYPDQEKFIFTSGQTYNQVTISAELLKKCVNEFGPGFNVHCIGKLSGAEEDLSLASVKTGRGYTATFALFQECKNPTITVDGKSVNLQDTQVTLEVERILI